MWRRHNTYEHMWVKGGDWKCDICKVNGVGYNSAQHSKSSKHVDAISGSVQSHPAPITPSTSTATAAAVLASIAMPPASASTLAAASTLSIVASANNTSAANNATQPQRFVSPLEMP